MRVMAPFQLHFLQNACVRVRMAPGQGHLCHIDTFLVHIFLIPLRNICVSWWMCFMIFFWFPHKISGYHDKCFSWYFSHFPTNNLEMDKRHLNKALRISTVNVLKFLTPNVLTKCICKQCRSRSDCSRSSLIGIRLLQEQSDQGLHCLPFH